MASMFDNLLLPVTRDVSKVISTPKCADSPAVFDLQKWENCIMKLKNLTRLLFVILMAGLVSLGPVVMAVGVTVKPSMMDGWNFQLGHLLSGTSTALGGFSLGPGSPPLGTGSVHFTTGLDGNSYAQIRNSDYGGQPLSGLTALSYDTYVSAHHGSVAPYIVLNVDVNDDGIFDPNGGIDDLIFFEPAYQTGQYNPTIPAGQTIPVQNGPVHLSEDGTTPTVVTQGVWQHWDAFAGGWWSGNYGGQGGPPLTLLSGYKSLLTGLGYATPRIINADACLGGVRIISGAGAPVWNDFDGNADNFTIGINLNDTTYDFEFENLPIAPCGGGDQGNGCTVTIGFWKNHAGFTGHNPDLITSLLPISLGSGGGKTIVVTTAVQAVALLGFKGSNGVFDASNGINKLYSQLLAAKLSIAGGADSSAIAATIAAADAFLATKNSGDWKSLSKSQKQAVLGWMSTLDSYNNGLIGPGHCDQ